jgi:hypothetical protein
MMKGRWLMKIGWTKHCKSWASHEESDNPSGLLQLLVELSSGCRARRGPLVLWLRLGTVKRFSCRVRPLLEQSRVNAVRHLPERLIQCFNECPQLALPDSVVLPMHERKLTLRKHSLTGLPRSPLHRTWWH